MTPEKILAFVAAVMAGPTSDGFPTLTQGGYDDRYPVAIEDCPAPVPALDIEGQTVVCGTVTVPENHDAPEGRKIPLQFAVMKATSEAPRRDALVYLHGGPGGKSVPEMAGFAKHFVRYREDRDIVMFDQRASGISDATVTCFNTLGENLFALAGKEKPQGDPVRACLDELKASGVELAAYNTTQNAKDVRAIMSALGYPTYNAYGASYGTLLGQDLMRVAPNGLRAIVLDSVAPTFGRGYDGNQLTVDKAVGSLVDQCMEQDECAAAFPNLEADVRGLGDKLTANPIPATATRPEINLETLQHLWEQRNGGALPGIDPYLPTILTEWAAGGSKTWDLYKSGALTPPLTSAAIAGAFKGKVDASHLTAAYSAALQAEQLRSLNTSLESLITLLAFNTTHPPADVGLEARLDDKLSELATKLDHDQILAMGKEYTRFVAVTPTRDEISDWAAKYLSGEGLNEVGAMIAAMTDADLAQFRARAEKDTGKYYSKLADGYFDLSIYACQESVPFNSREGWEEVKKSYRFPWVEDGELEEFYMLCDSYDHIERPGFHDPVSSDIPVLAMQGLADTQTDNDAATRVAETLSNAQVVTFAQSGHGVILYSQCAKDIMATFLDYPEEQVDTSCAEKLKPHFVLPDGKKSDG